MSDQGGWGGQAPPQQQYPQPGYEQQYPQPGYQQQYQQPGGAPAWGYGQAPPGQLEEAPSGLIAMILGIVGIVLFPVIPSIIAIVFGNKAKREAQGQPYRYKNTFGKVGVITGWIGIALGVLYLLLFAVGLAAALSSGDFS